MNSINNPENINFLVYLQDLIDKRKSELPEGSYTTKLFKKGLNKITQKVGEEAIELIEKKLINAFLKREILLEKINSIIKENHIEFIGLDAEGLTDGILMCLK